MKKTMHIMIVLIMVFSLALPVSAAELDPKTDVQLDKTWTITFNMKVDESTINSDNIYITDSTGNIFDSIVNLRNDGSSVYLIPKSNYNWGKTYRIHISNKVKSEEGNILKERIEMEFITKSINHAPEIINEIEDMILKEGEVITIDLNTVFQDPDGDVLTFGATGGDIYDNIFRYTVDKDIDTILIGATDGEETITCEFDVILNKSIDFGDRNIEDAVREAINKPSGVIYVEDVKGITELVVNKKAVSNLEGIQYLTGLKELKLAVNEISDISYLSGLTELESLDLRGNNIKNIAVLSNLTNLISLELGYNEITNISSLQNLDKLKELDISYNQIKDISPLKDIAGNLEILMIIENPIEDYSPIEDFTENN